MNNTTLSAQVNGIILNPCIGCIYRGKCDEEFYISRGEDCRAKVTEEDTSDADI
jgi:hypothetical protein